VPSTKKLLTGKTKAAKPVTNFKFSMLERADVTVIGAGPAGAAVAATLAKGGFRTAIIESDCAPVWKIGETLAPESLPFLERLGVNRHVLQENGHLPSPGSCSAWGSNDLVLKDFISNPNGCGWQLDRVRFERMLQNLAANAGAKIRHGLRVQEIIRDGNEWNIKLDGQLLKSRWLIDSSGRGAVVARRLGASRSSLDRLVSVYARHMSPTATDLDARTLIEASPNGWWYSALTPGGRRTVAFQTDADLLVGQEWRSAEWFRRKIRETRHVSALLERHTYLMEDQPRLISAYSGRLNPCHGDGWLAAGDAALCVDPLSGQGLLNALITARHAAEALVEQRKHHGFARFAAVIDLAWHQFLNGRRRHYRTEKRWPRNPFWERRSY